MPLEKTVLGKVILFATLTSGVFVVLFRFVSNILLLAFVYIIIFLSLVFIIDSYGSKIFCKGKKEKNEAKEFAKNKVITRKKSITTTTSD